MRRLQIKMLLLFPAAAFLVTHSSLAFYNPSTGRWLNRDSIGERGGANLSNFTANPPVSHRDADGRLMTFAENNAVSRIDILGLASVNCEEGCKLAQELGLVRSGDVAGVICYKGIPCPCVWQPGGGSKPTHPVAKVIVYFCTMLHEVTHLPDVECKEPKVCYWAGTKPRIPRDFIEGADSECKAYRAHWGCLQVLGALLCGNDTECGKQVMAEAAMVQNQVENWCRWDYPNLPPKPRPKTQSSPSSKNPQ